MRASRTQRSQESYDDYVKKYTDPPKTKDDTFTPPAAYDCVKKWVLENYPQFTERDLIRPFWPGADYTRCDYPEGCLVLDTPPWSITTPICRWFTEHRINYFLFANHTTHFSALRIPECHAVVCGAKIIFENGAEITTSFLTNLGAKIRVAGDLNHQIKAVQKQRTTPLRKYHPSYNIVTGTRLGKYANAGYSLDLTSAQFQDVDNGYHIFGGGAILSDAEAQMIADLQRSIEERKP